MTEHLKIKEIRLQKKLTQEKLASLSGVTTPTINRIEKSGKCNLSTYFKIINALNNYHV